MEIDLKQCPFCGDTSAFVIEYATDYFQVMYRVICDNCRCGSGPCRSKAKAIEAWNMRDGDERKTGKWLSVAPAPNNMWYCTCSNCKERQTVEMRNYCPNCGADMREDKNENQ